MSSTVIAFHNNGSCNYLDLLYDVKMVLSGHKSPVWWPLGAATGFLTANQHYQDKWQWWLTLRPQQVWIEAQEVGAEVEPALARHFASPVAAWVIRDQLFLRRQLKPLLEPQECLSELLRIFFQHQGRLPFLSNKTLPQETLKGL